MNEVLRKEKKYIVSIEDVKKLTHKLRHVVHEDAHSINHAYMVRSLYFDALNERDYYDKEDGVNLRRKIRLRIYDPNNNFAMLEMKQKQGSMQHKRSLRISRHEAKSMIQGNYSVLLNYSNTFAAECYAMMQMYVYRPKTVVTYNRRAYIVDSNTTRITIDSDICATESNFDIFSERLIENRMINVNSAVLEVKYYGFLLSYIKELINTCDKSQTALSKYCLGRTTSMNYKL